MEHIGVDIGGKKSQVCVRDGGGEILEEARVATRQLGAYLRARPQSRVVMETCAEAFAIADEASRAKHTVNVVPATLVRSLGEGMPACVERHLRVLEELNEQLKAADAALAQIVAQHPICSLLMTAPAVGPVTAARLVSSIDDVRRFPNAHALESYLGLTPGESHRIAERRTRHVAICAMMRKLAGILYAMWRDNRVYEPNRPVIAM